MPLCKRLERSEFMLGYVPQDINFDALARVFETLTKFSKVFSSPL